MSQPTSLRYVNIDSAPSEQHHYLAERAKDCLSDPLTSVDDYAHACRVLAHISFNSKEYRTAVMYLNHEIQERPSACVYDRAAFMHRTLGAMELSLHYAMKAVAIEPCSMESLKVILESGNIDFVFNTLDSLKERFSSFSSTDQASILRLTANCYEHYQQYAQAYDCYVASNSLYLFNHDGPVSRDYLPIIHQYHAMSKAVEINNTDICPVLINGLSRSGTSLVESRLVTCDLIGTVGETNYLRDTIGQTLALGGSVDTCVNDDDTETDSIKMRQCLEGYLDYLSTINPGKKLVIDKTNHHFALIPFLSDGLSQFKCIHLQRHPMDAFIAMFTTCIGRSYLQSYHVNSLVDLIRQYYAMMHHWLTYVPDVDVCLVKYETLVTHPDAEFRRIYEYLGVEFRDEYLALPKKPVTMATESARAIRQEIFDTSIGKWRSYAQQLEPVRQILSPIIEAYEETGEAPYYFTNPVS